MNLIIITYTCFSVSLSMCTLFKLLLLSNKQMKWNNNNRKNVEMFRTQRKFDLHQSESLFEMKIVGKSGEFLKCSKENFF